MPDFSTYEKQIISQLKAEVVCAELVSQDIPFDNIRYIPTGSFRKSYRADIDTINHSENGMDIVVNRDGLYDKIPEGVFHQTRGNSGTRVNEMVAEHKRYKAEEKNARRFFNPFEQEFFRYSLMVEQMERNLTGSLQDENMLSLFRRLWNIDANLPKDATQRFLNMIPWAATIKNNLLLSAQTLEFILNKSVSFEELIKEERIISANEGILGSGALGMDATIGNYVSVPLWIWKFTINDIEEDEMITYTSDEPYGVLLKTFETFFLPLEIDALFEYNTKTMEAQSLNETFLGYNLTL